MKRLLFTLLIIASAMLVASGALDRKQTTVEQPVVTKAVAPVYPAIAVAARAEGKVVVEMTLDSAGNIVRIHATEGHPLLSKAALNASGRWQFAPGTRWTSPPTIHLTFIFRLVSDIKEEETSFSPPYKIEVAYSPPKILSTSSH